MVSVQNLDEALEALHGGADIVDVKNLQEALVGSAHPVTVKAVRKAIPLERHASVTLGVVPNQTGTVAMAVYAAGVLNATSVKVGFMKTEYSEAVETLLACRAALEGFETKLIGSLFADNPLYAGLDAEQMVPLALDGTCDGFLIDTLAKDGRNLFDFISETKLREMVVEGKSHGMSTALSGHLRLDDLNELSRINPDIVGVRGAVCQKGDRQSGVHRDAVSEFKHQLNIRETGQVNVRSDTVSAEHAREAVDGWVVIDGTGKSCAGILAALTAQIEEAPDSFIEVIIPDVLNTYDVILWAEGGDHSILTQRKDPSGATRMLIRP
ncbi:(5-formylfuran-3-yl)methyl phosphate synthase [Dehalococcoidia bacterium]|nr:(5-formylfuran-3-yl)methyl phosphate synthase [Dehalococcoidia bacterium]